MRQNRDRRLSAIAIGSRSRVLIVLALLWAGPALGQYSPPPGWPSGMPIAQPPQIPRIPPPPMPAMPPPYVPTGDPVAEMEKRAANWNKNLTFPRPDPALTKKQDDMIWQVFVATLVLGGIAVVSLAFTWYVRLSASTDPRKIALSDPWVQAHLNQVPNAPEGEQRGSTPPPPV